MHTTIMAWVYAIGTAIAAIFASVAIRRDIKAEKK